MKKTKFLLLLFVLLLALIFYFSIPSSGVTRDNYAKIEIGMTKTRVESIFGDAGHTLDLLGQGGNKTAHLKRWFGDGFEIYVQFDESWFVTRKVFHPSPVAKENKRTALDWLSSFLGSRLTES